ncbi:MAG TPA: hypothetical protein DDZ80_23840 [Cyanobacteria bacterium UBA8803]|nr:hypothetical protein [Cyanobacteria bacterium UBA9273]HBL61349.1 hypothetical protein [Cyanobacteria bacterium UBA8803]
MYIKRRSAILSFFLLLTVWGVTACGGQATDALESADPRQPPTDSSIEPTQSVTVSETVTDLPSELTPSPSQVKQTPVAQEAQPSRDPVQVTSRKVKVFFPKSPNSDRDFTYVEPVWRTTTSPGIARFAIEQLIAGPTNEESRKGLINAIDLQGSSNCGQDFTLAISQGVARLQLCKTVVSGGVGDDARAISAIEATLKQFPTIQSIVILDKDGNCFGDGSGENLCLVSIKKSKKLSAQSQLTIRSKRITEW